MFTLAHLSDPHLGPMPSHDRLTDFLGKRFIGLCSWHFRRRQIHDPQVLDAVLADIAAHAPDHVALTGDLINLALPAEFPRAARFLERIGAADRVTVVPGNHDAYVAVPWQRGCGYWADYMTGDMRMPGHPLSPEIAAAFPFVRQRRNLALIGVSSAVPQGLLRAGGMAGVRQLEDLTETLRRLGERGYFRIVLIHHPPLPGMAIARKALDDAAALRDVLVSAGAELVLHGHNHRFMQADLGPARIFGVPSASSNGQGSMAPAGWMLHKIERKGAAWQVSHAMREWDALSQAMKTVMEMPGSSG